jgi:hypothetical protein
MVREMVSATVGGGCDGLERTEQVCEASKGDKTKIMCNRIATPFAASSIAQCSVLVGTAYEFPSRDFI